MNPNDEWPTEDRDRELLADLLAGSAPATAAVVSAYLAPLTTYLEGLHRGSSEQCATAAGDAILSVCQRTGQFNPGQLGLGAYLRMSARGDLLNFLHSEARHYRNRIPLEFVAEPADGRNEVVRDDETDDRGWDHPSLVAAITTLDPNGRAAFELMRVGERATTAFAPLVGSPDRSSAEVARDVKRLKDRVKKHLIRAVQTVEKTR